jgi:phenylalanyl-tRNA synthetase beta chain
VKISLNWIKDYADFTAPPEEISRAITFLGFEVEGIVRSGAPALEHVVVGEVLERKPHPNAERLSVCQVDIGPAGGVKTIVCGAQNYQVGDRIPVALPGAILPGNFAIKQSKIRGELSDGMMCSGKELGIGDDHSGLLILAGRPDLGAPINAVLPPGDVVFDIEITPNRPDCQSHLGIARELAAWFDLPLRYPRPRPGTDRRQGAHAIPANLLAGIAVEAPEDCPLYTAHVVTGVKIGPSPAWLQDRLRAVGLRPVNNVVDAGNYVMLEYGQPLHAFDTRFLAGNRIVIRRATDGEKIVTLDGKERVLTRSMLVIADGAKPVVIAGIMGGENSGVRDDTTDLVIEGAIFRPQSIRPTSRKLGLSSDSSYRYERGVDSHATWEAVHRALELIVQLAGGQIADGSFSAGGDTPWQREITVETGFIHRRLGFIIPEAEMRQSLESLELKIVREAALPHGGFAWTVAIPSWRDDLDRPIDLVEEVLRLHGTDKIPAAVVLSPGLAAEDDPAVEFNRRAMTYLVGHDFHECVNLTLRPAAELSTWISETAAQELALSNPFVEDQSHLRPSLIPGLLEALKLNQSRGVNVSRLAETGRIFIERNGQILECASVAFLLAQSDAPTWLKRPAPDFFTVKHHLAALAEIAGIDFARQPVSLATTDLAAWQDGHVGVAGDSAYGWLARFGLLNLARVRAQGVSGLVYAAVLVILPEKLPARGVQRRRYTEFSLFPAALRDLALVVDAATPAAALQKQLTQIARAAVGAAFALESVTVFDVYAGTGLPPGKKSLAYSLVFRAADRTLTDAEVNAVFQKIQDEVVAKTGCTIRK